MDFLALLKGFGEWLEPVARYAGYCVTALQAFLLGGKAIRSWRRRRGHTPPRQAIERAKALRQEILEHLADLPNGGKFLEIIVRDVRRRAEFPTVDPDAVEISPWFKAELYELYHNGIEIVLGGGERAVPLRDEDGLLAGWRFLSRSEAGRDDSAGEGKVGLNTIRIGRIPFDFIEAIDWYPDEYWGCPHFYCRFANPFGAPYEDVVYRAKLIPKTSDEFFLLEGLHGDGFAWGPLRRRAFVVWRRVTKWPRRKWAAYTRQRLERKIRNTRG